jgi:hypothetical protein
MCIAEAGPCNWETRANPIGDQTVKTNIAGTFCFLTVVILGLRVALSGGLRSPWARRRWTNIFLWAVLFISFGAGLTQHDLWPFSSWPVLAHRLPTGWSYSAPPHIVGVDLSGKEHEIDYRAWQPMALEELTSWIRLHFAHLDPAERDRAGAYLLRRANRGREQALSPAGLPYPNRWFGRLTAPTHMLHPAIWSHPENVPRNPFVELRIYGETWNVEERRRDQQKVTRVLIFDYRQQ